MFRVGVLWMCGVCLVRYIMGLYGSGGMVCGTIVVWCSVWWCSVVWNNFGGGCGMA